MAVLRLKEALKKKKISHREFARLVKTDRGTLGRYLRGEGNPRFDTLKKWAKALKIKVRDLIKE